MNKFKIYLKEESRKYGALGESIEYSPNNQVTHKGIYIAAKFTQDSVSRLETYSDLLGIAPFSTDDKYYHCTIVYTPTYFECKDFDKINKLITSLKPVLKFKEFKLFGENKQCLVLTLDKESCDFLRNIKNILIGDNEIEETHDVYTPHVTLSYEYDNFELPQKIPNFVIEIESLIIEDLEEDYV